MVPSGTLPNDASSGVAASAGVTPVPSSAYFTVLFVALLMIVNVLDTVLLVVGVNLTVMVRFAPAASVFGADSPVTLNSVPDTDVAEIATLAVLVFLIVTLILWLDSRPTLPKLADAGVKESVPFARGVVRGVGAPVVTIASALTNQVDARAATLAVRNGLLSRICRR